MSPVGSRVSRSGYDPARVTAGGFAGELARLEAQAALTFPAELRVLRALDVSGCGDLVEVGCGPGAFTRRLAEAMPDLRVAGLDASMELLDRGCAGPDRYPAIGGDARALPLRDHSVGGVLMRYVLQHVSAPEAVLGEARRILRPGGALYVVEVDSALWGLAEPHDPRLFAVQQRVAMAQRGAGADRTIARRLPRMLGEAGFTGVVTQPFAVTSDDRPVDDFALHLGPDRIVPLVRDGAVSLADLAEVSAGWARFRADPSAWVMLLGFVVAAHA